MCGGFQVAVADEKEISRGGKDGVLKCLIDKMGWIVLGFMADFRFAFAGLFFIL